VNGYEKITEQIIAELENGAAPWVKPWRADSTAAKNIVSGKAYQGINRLILGMGSMMPGYTPYWASYKQWAERGAQVRKGEKGTQIVFFSPVTKEQANAAGELEEKQFAVLRLYTVFNSAQCENAEVPVATVSGSFDPIQAAEQRIVKTGAIIRHGGDAAFYSPAHDSIQMPHKVSFDSPASYYCTAFHELGHWTGAKHRLEREFGGKFGNPAYAFEELVAELTAAFLCQEHGIAGELRHAGYIGSWLKACRDDAKAIFKAAALAQKAADYILSLDAELAIAA
jgi:antirestriction protein ArdC